MTSFLILIGAQIQLDDNKQYGSKSCMFDLLQSSKTSKPLIEFIFGIAVFSPTKVGVSSTITDPSHPCQVSQCLGINTSLKSDKYLNPLNFWFNLRRVYRKKRVYQ